MSQNTKSASRTPIRRSYVIAGIIFVVLAAWVASGALNSSDKQAKTNTDASGIAASAATDPKTTPINAMKKPASAKQSVRVTSITADEGFPPMDAIVRTGVQRMRPVLLTTWTAIFGLLPLMYKFDVDFFERQVHFGGPSADWWVPLATAIVYGLAFSTFLTLFVTPAMLAIEQRYWADGKFWPRLKHAMWWLLNLVFRGRWIKREPKPEAAE